MELKLQSDHAVGSIKCKADEYALKANSKTNPKAKTNSKVKLNINTKIYTRKMWII